MDTWIEFDLSPEPDGASALAAALELGDLAAAAHAYEGLPPETAALWAEALPPASLKQGAEVCQRARDFGQAARLLERAGEHGPAAEQYGQSGEHPQAAACFVRAGQLAEAGAAYERAGRVEKALLFYQQGRAPLAMAECLARHERYPEAAAIYRKLENLHAEVEMLRKVPGLDPQWLPCTRRLAVLMEEHGHLANAVRLLTSAARSSPQARADPELLTAVVRMLERLGKAPEAARVRASLQGLSSAPAPEEPGPVLVGEEEAEGDLMDASSAAYGHLKAIPIFARLSAEDLRDLYRIAQELSFAPGAVLIEQGQPGTGLMVLWSGVVDVFAVGSKGGSFLNRIEPGGYVGEISLVRDEPTTARVVAAAAVRVLFLSREAFTHYLATHPEAALRIFQVFTSNLAERVKVLSSVS